MTLATLHNQISECTACPLHQGRTLAVPGEGPDSPTVMFIGEAPGFYEDKQGRPFVGQAGKLLDELLAVAGLERENVYITNVIKCRPPNNRDPLPTEMDTCQDLWLNKQIELLRPKAIVTLGRYSLSRFFPRESISRVRAKSRWHNGLVFYPMYHPAAALHQQRLRDTLFQDMRGLPAVIAQAESRGAEASQPSPQPEGPQQLSML